MGMCLFGRIDRRMQARSAAVRTRFVRALRQRGPGRYQPCLEDRISPVS